MKSGAAYIFNELGINEELYIDRMNQTPVNRSWKKVSREEAARSENMKLVFGVMPCPRPQGGLKYIPAGIFWSSESDMLRSWSQVAQLVSQVAIVVSL